MESLYAALKNIDRADIVTSLEAPQPGAGPLEEGACRLSERDSTLLSPSVINGKTTPTRNQTAQQTVLFSEQPDRGFHRFESSIDQRKERLSRSNALQKLIVPRKERQSTIRS